MKEILLLLLLSTNLQQPKSKSWIYHNNKADYFYHLGNYPEMIYHLSEKVKIDPKDVESWSDIGYYYWSMSVDEKERKKEFEDKALLNLKKGLEKNKDTSYMWDELGRHYLVSRKDYQTATFYFEEAIKKSDVGNITFHLLALCYDKTNKFNECVKTLSECIKKFPNDQKAKTKLKSYEVSF